MQSDIHKLVKSYIGNQYQVSSDYVFLLHHTIKNFTKKVVTKDEPITKEKLLQTYPSYANIINDNVRPQYMSPRRVVFFIEDEYWSDNVSIDYDTAISLAVILEHIIISCTDSCMANLQQGRKRRITDKIFREMIENNEELKEMLVDDYDDFL